MNAIINKTEFKIGVTPVVLYGENSDKLFIFVHGQGGNKYEGERFFNVAKQFSYQVLAVDLPGHGERTDGEDFVPWKVSIELKRIFDYAKQRWAHISLRATSIGSYFSLLALKGEKIEHCLLVSPLLDMENMICSLMAAANVSESRLKAEKQIPTEFGQTLSYDYLCFARENPPEAVCLSTRILYATGDTLIPRETVEKFSSDNGAILTVMQGGEHWLHTKEQVEFMQSWETAQLKDF